MNHSTRTKRLLKDKESYLDPRTPFQHDRDRILHASALRRLAGVTQVVNPLEGQVFHNRLTHSLKVAQIGRRIAENLIRLARETSTSNKLTDAQAASLFEKFGGLDPEVVEAACLAHDLGHPPFGHTGERTLNRLVTRYNKDGYDGNAQSFRIVTRLAVRHPKHFGLNLTVATLWAILKYPWFRNQINPNSKAYHKWGIYRTEEQIFGRLVKLSKKVKKKVKLSEKSELADWISLESAIMDWADDIAYAIHDLEDFYRVGLIPLPQLVAEARLAKEMIDKSKADILKEEDNFTKEIDAFLHSFIGFQQERGLIEGEEVSEKKQEAKRALMELLDLLPFEREYQGSRQEQALLRLVMSNMINRYVQNTYFNMNVDSGKECLSVDENLKLEVNLLKQLVFYYVIENRALQTQQYGEQQILEFLFDTYYKISGSKDPQTHQILPKDFDELVEEESDQQGNNGEKFSKDELRARVVADVISRMTDAEAVFLYHRLSGSNLGSFLDIVP